MATLTSLSLSTPKFAAKATETPKAQPVFALNNPWKRAARVGLGSGRVRAAPDSISDKVVESIKSAEEQCAEDPKSGECAAAWDEVEELSAAASHAKAKKKDSDSLETYCQDNQETDECRTYDN